MNIELDSQTQLSNTCLFVCLSAHNGDEHSQDYYPRGEYIVRQGSFGESFFIISKGMVRVTQVRQHKPTSSPDGKCTGAPVVKEETLRTLSIGDYFGEQALLLGLSENDAFTGEESAAIRTANVVSEDCECLVLDHANFFTLIGDLNEIKYTLPIDDLFI